MADDISTEDAAALCGDIWRQRGDECIMLALERWQPKPDADPIDVLDAFVVRLGFSALDGAWREIDAQQARPFAAEAIGRSMVYGHQVLPQVVAADLAARFFGLFAAGPLRCFTNTERGDSFWDSSHPVSWTPLTTSTFDTGIAVLGPGQLGLLWAREED